MQQVWQPQAGGTAGAFRCWTHGREPAGLKVCGGWVLALVARPPALMPCIGSFSLRENTSLLDLGHEEARCKAVVGRSCLAGGSADWVVQLAAPRRCIRLSRLNDGADAFQFVRAFGGEGWICSTPELSPTAADPVLLAWSQRRANALWEGKVALLKDGEPIATAALAETTDVLFPQAQQSPDGDYWVAYEKCEPKGSEIVLRNVTKELRQGTGER